MNTPGTITRVDPDITNMGWRAVMDAINALKQDAEEKPAADGAPSITVATLRELHGAADEIGGLFCKLDNITRALGALTNRFENDQDESAADYLIGEIEDTIGVADSKLNKIVIALTPYQGG